MHLLLICSDDETAGTVLGGLLPRGHRIDQNANGLIAFSMPAEPEYDAILIDEELPYLRGVEIAQHLRRRGIGKPLLLLSTFGSDGHRRIARDAGVDCLVVKPASAIDIEQQLCALIDPNSVSRAARNIRIGDIEVDRGCRRFTCDGKTVDLTRTQTLLLWALAEQADMVVGREELNEKVFRYHDKPTEEMLTSLVAALRRRLASAGFRELIITIRGFGYMLSTGTGAEKRPIRPSVSTDLPTATNRI